MDPRDGLDGCGKSRPHWDSIPGPSSPQRVAIPTELSLPHEIIKIWLNSGVLFRKYCSNFPTQGNPVKVKVKQSHYRPGVAQRVPGS